MLYVPADRIPEPLFLYFNIQPFVIILVLKFYVWDARSYSVFVHGTYVTSELKELIRKKIYFPA
jgi:hypothetical protein